VVASPSRLQLSVDNRDTTGFTLRTQPPPPVIDRADELRRAARADGIDRATRDHANSRRACATRAAPGEHSELDTDLDTDDDLD
jgi:hypothetical protein